MAYDTIMVFQDRFRNHILPDKLHMLNVSFLVPQMRREFGGCAGNIAYNLKLLGDPGYVMATVGHDFGPYARLDATARACRATTSRVVAEEHTGQAFITTDLDNNQITAFHPGAMGHSHLQHGGRCEGRRDRHRRAGWPRRHDPARTAVRRRRHSVHLRSRARACRCSAARTCKRFIEQADLGDRERLRVEPDGRAHRLERG